ncbi:MAG: DUF2207 domain-containing protein [Trueperaceae bacterium]|nr:DUF2207 domain-containing protein [Trueperaceae bacterium]
MAVGWAQSYQWRDVVQTVDIQADGTIIVDDERTLVATSGDFNEAFICLDLTANQSLELLDGGALGAGPNARAYTQPCEDGSGGTELVVEMDNEFRVAERRVFYRYALSNTLDYYSDVTQWYWIILEEDHPPVRGYELTVTTPGSMQSPYDAYVHRFSNPEQPDVSLSDDRSRLQVTFDRIPRGDGVEIRYLMDPSLFEQQGSRQGLEQLLRDEAEIAGVLERQRFFYQLRGSPLWGIAAILLVGAISAGIWRDYRRVGQEPDLPQLHHNFEPPSDIPPAAVAAMLHQRFKPQNLKPGFSATVMDLARRGYGEFEKSSGFMGFGEQFGMTLRPGKDSSELLPYEIDVLEYLIAAAGRHGDLTRLDFAELKKHSQRNWSKFISRWGREVRDWVERRAGGPLVTEESMRALKIWSGIAFVGLLVSGVAGIWLLVDTARVIAWVTLAVCVLLIIVANVSLPAWRKEVAPEIYGWQGFKRTLRDYTIMKDAPDDFFKLWDRYFCYAAALGVAKSFLQNVQKGLSERGFDERSMVRQAHWMNGSDLSASDFSSFSDAVTSMSSALNSASASASSGGSSSGGGGGGGGGSSGGR